MKRIILTTLLSTMILFSAFSIDKISSIYCRGNFIEAKRPFINVTDNEIYVNIGVFNDTLHIDESYIINDVYTMKGKYNNEDYIIRAINKNGNNIIIIDINHMVYYLIMESTNYLANSTPL